MTTRKIDYLEFTLFMQLQYVGLKMIIQNVVTVMKITFPFEYSMFG